MRRLLHGYAYSLFGLLFFATSVQAGNDVCSEMAKIEELVSYEDLFIGEVHGTVEVPIFFKCLIEKSIEVVGDEIIVSLEMAEFAKNPSSSFWRSDDFEDGRSSEAMFDLVESLVEMERMGLVELHFQLGAMGYASAESTGKELRVLAGDHKVIALGGNMHSRKHLPSGSSNGAVKGMYVGPSFTHVMVTSTKGGEAWICKSLCGVNALAPWPTDEVTTDSVIDGASYEHDLIYFLPTDYVSASQPMDIEAE